MTGQDLLDRMELVNQELQLQVGEEDVTRGLLALNVAQDYFETYVALIPKALGDQTGTVTTSASTESTAFPTGVLRIDRLQYIDPSTSRPGWDLEPIQRVGAHSPGPYWNLVSASTSSTGKPKGYWTNGRNIYWKPLPDGTNTVRWYGFQAAGAISAVGTFEYPDIVAFPLAAFAVKILKVGVDDDPGDVGALTQEAFRPVVNVLQMFRRDGANRFEYEGIHST